MLRIRDVTHRYGSWTALDGVSFDVPRGSFVSFLGPSGCGKTTLLRIIAGFLKPTEGRLFLDEKCLSSPGAVIAPEHRGMGMVFQNYAVWPHMTVYGNVSYGLRLRRLGSNVVRERTLQALDLVNLNGLQDRLPSELSGGQQQRVAIARSIATEPNVLLLDEPLSNLDIALRRELLHDLRRIQQASGITFIYVTHDQGEALSVSDLIAVFERGRCCQMASPRDIYQNPSDLFVARFVGNANIVSATARSDGTGRSWLAIGTDAELSLPYQNGATCGATCTVAIKRRAISFQPAGGHSGVATVIRTSFIGDYEEVVVSLGGLELHGFAEPNLLRAGDTVSVNLDPANCHVFA